MAEMTKIEWADSTFNPVIGCTKISPACDFCYAEEWSKRYGRAQWGNHPRQRTSDGTWNAVRKWQRDAPGFFAEHGRKRRVFCASLADVFDNQWDPQWRHDLWLLIQACPDLDFLLLTKRPQNIGKLLPTFWPEIRSHVWLGTTVEDQQRADQNIPHLLQHDAAVRFVSIEPMLGPIDLTDLSKPAAIGADHFDGLHCDVAPEDDDWQGRTINWVIAGGESGPQARPSHPDWFRSLRDQCAATGVPFLFKQWGALLPEEIGSEDIRSADFPPGHIIHHRVGKKTAGRKLDGVEHNGFPEVSR